MTIRPLEEKHQKTRTLRLSIIEGTAWSFMVGFGDLFITPFAIFLGAGNRAVALIATLPHLVGSLAQMAGAYWTDRLKTRRGLIVPLTALQAILFIPLVIAPLTWTNFAVPLLLVFAAFSVMTGHSVAPAWISMMGDVVPDNQRGAYFGRRGRIVIMAVFLTHLAAGGVLTLFEKSGHVPAGFITVFMIAAAARIISSRLLASHYDPPYNPSRETGFSFFDFIRRMPQSNFARFAMFHALMIGTTNIAAPFFAVYMLRDLGWSYAQFTLNAATFLGTQFVMIQWWGRIGDRHGNRVVVLATSVILVICPILWIVSTNYFYLLWVQVFAGVGWSGYNLAVQNFTFDAVSPPKRARIASYVSLLNGICSVTGSAVIGAWLANHLPVDYNLGGFKLHFISSLPLVFVASTIARGLIASMMIRRFKEVRSIEEPIHPVTLILRVAGGEAISYFFAGRQNLNRRSQRAQR